MLEHILVGLDGSPLAESILAYVGALAKDIGAQVTLLHVVPVSPSLRSGDSSRFLGPLIEQEETQAYGYLRGVTQQLIAAGLKVQSRVMVGDAATEIVRTAQHEKVDFIALATHGRSGLQRWVYGSVAEKVLHTTRTPLLLVRPSEEHAQLPSHVTRIVVPLDGSPLAETVLPIAEALAAQCKIPLVLLRVIEIVSLTFVDPMGMAGVNYQALSESFQETADTYVNELAAKVRERGMTVETATPLGTPADKIVGYSHDHPGSLVVMATHGRSGVAEVILGSVARRVVQHGDTPTLMVHPLISPGAVSSSAPD
ncbi:MAG: universal stress protein [Deltaproteobacteria bacterium]|nr:universal stress protein [Deltaproteobacteria bacterium]